MKIKEIQTKLAQEVIDQRTEESILEAIDQNAFYAKHYKILSSEEAKVLYNLFNKNIGIDEATDDRLFKKLHSLVKAHPKEATIVQTKVVKAMKSYSYAEYYGSKMDYASEMVSAWPYWEEALLNELATAIVKKSGSFSRNTSDEYGDSFYYMLQSLVVVIKDSSTQTAVQECIEKYYEDSPSDGYLYKSEPTVFLNTLSVYDSARLFEQVIEHYEAKKSVLQNEDTSDILKAQLYLAKAYGELGDEQKMLEICQTIKDAKTDYEQVYTHLVEYYEAKGKLDICLTHLDALYQANPKPYYIEKKIRFFKQNQMHQEMLDLVNQPLDFGYLKSQVEQLKTDATKALSEA